jgi:hypothetical protein
MAQEVTKALKDSINDTGRYLLGAFEGWLVPSATTFGTIDAPSVKVRSGDSECICSPEICLLQ